MMLIDEFLPAYNVTERHQIDIDASLDEVYEATRSLDLSESRIVRLLFRLRELPASFNLRAENKRGLGLTLDELLSGGFILLGERPREEILLGLVGRFWTMSGCIQRLTPEEFPSFAAPGYAKAAWNFSLSRRADRTTRLRTETRVLCLDEASRRRFLVYWSIIAPFSGLVRKEALRAIRRKAEMRG